MNEQMGLTDYTDVDRGSFFYQLSETTFDLRLRFATILAWMEKMKDICLSPKSLKGQPDKIWIQRENVCDGLIRAQSSVTEWEWTLEPVLARDWPIRSRLWGLVANEMTEDFSDPWRAYPGAEPAWLSWVWADRYEDTCHSLRCPWPTPWSLSLSLSSGVHVASIMTNWHSVIRIIIIW